MNRFDPADLKPGMRVRIDTNITAYHPDPKQAVERMILEVNNRDGHVRISEGWFAPRRVVEITETRGSESIRGRAYWA